MKKTAATGTPLMYVDKVSGEVQCVNSSGLQQQQPMLLGVKQDKKSDSEKEKERKKKDKKDKTGIKKHKKKKHSDNDGNKERKKKKKKKKEKNLGKAVAEAGTTDEQKRLQDTIAKAAEKRAKLLREAEQARLTEEALRAELQNQQQQQQSSGARSPPSVSITIEDSEDDEEEEGRRIKKEKEVVVEQMAVEEKTTDASSTTNPPPSPFVAGSEVTTSATTKPGKQPNRQNLTNALKKLHSDFTFLLQEANVYKQYGGVSGVDALHADVQAGLGVVAQQQDFMVKNKKLGQPQLDTISSIVARQQVAWAALVKRFKAAKFGDFRSRLVEWELGHRVAHIAAKKNSVPALNKYVLDHLALVEERLEALRRRVYEREGGHMQVEGGSEAVSAAKDRDERPVLHGRLKHLLSIANDDKSGVLALYNKTYDALATWKQLLADVRARYGPNDSDIPAGLFEKLRELHAKLETIGKAWDRREKYVGTVVDPRKDKKDEIMKDVVTQLPLMEALLSEAIDAAMLVEVKAHTEVPQRVITNPYKLFIEFDPKKSSRVQLFTKDQRGNQLNNANQTALDIEHIKRMCFTVNDGLYLAPSQFPNPHSRNGVYAAQDISKNQLITFCMGWPTKTLPSHQAGQLRPFVQLFYGVPQSGVPHWYLMLDEEVVERDEKGVPITVQTVSSDYEELVHLTPENHFYGAGALIHDCLNVAQYRHRLANRQVLVVRDSAGRGGRGGIDIDIEEERSVDASGDDESSVDLLGGDVRPSVADIELNVMSNNTNASSSTADVPTTQKTRPVINCRFQIYHDEYNELIHDVAIKKNGEDFLVLLDPRHSIVVVESTRTIRRGEELFIKFDDRVWDNYINGYGGAVNNGLPQGVQEVAPADVGKLGGLEGYTAPLNKALANELTRQSRIKHPLKLSSLPYYSASHIEPYQAPDNEDDEGVEEDEKKYSGDVDGSIDDDFSDSDDMVPESDEHWYEDDGSSDEDDEAEEEASQASFDEEEAIRGVRKELAALAKKIKPNDTRQSDIAVVRRLLEDIELRGDQMTDAQYQATFTEMMVREARVTEENAYFALENTFYRAAINELSGQLDKNSESFKLYTEFHDMRKKIEQMAVTNAVNNNTDLDAAIAQLMKQRDQRRMALADVNAEAEAEGLPRVGG